MRTFLRGGAFAGAAVAFLASGAVVSAEGDSGSPAKACPGDNGGLSLPAGFCATVFADHIGHARQMAVGTDGTLYVNTWSGRYYKGDKAPPEGPMLVALQDTSHSGRADKIERFGPTYAEGDHGGTGIGIYDGKLYAEANDRIDSYELKSGGVPTGKPTTVVSGLPITGDHPMHPFLIDAQGNLFVDLGSATNACQERNRSLESAGIKGCKELETRGGIWRFDANKTDQRFSPAERYASGLRNGEGLASDRKGRIFVTQHGRDQLYENWPNLYNAKQGEDLPSEEVVQLTKGADYGWPYCYFDPMQDKLMLAPEYGGDGKKVGQCADKTRPVATFPAHWAPNDMVIYKGDQFPKAYDSALFIAFHGSWNRAPSPQGGYNVVVQPFAGGQPTGKYQVFADGFAGSDKNPGQAAHRPSGLAVGLDGSLYISDDTQGTIWRVTYSGDKSAAMTSAPAASTSGKTIADAVPPEGIHPDAGALENAAALKAPDGTSKQQIALGQKIFLGEAKDGTCATCHGTNAMGLPIGPSLVKKDWLWGDGSLKAIEATITDGVSNPKEHPGMMPPKGGAPLTSSDVDAVAAYIYALNHQS